MKRVSSPLPMLIVSYLAQAVQDSIMLNRLPMPEPTVFKGDPIHFIEWKLHSNHSSTRENVSSADKLYYYEEVCCWVCSEIFRRHVLTETMRKLTRMHGKDFKIAMDSHSSYKDHSERNSQAGPESCPRTLKDSEIYQISLIPVKTLWPHVKGLEILNDCEENRKLVSKLPDWAAARWNRQVTQTLSATQDFPTFQEFAHFMSIEAEVACNPVTSFHALHDSEANKEKHNLKVSKNKASVFHTKIVIQHEKESKAHWENH